VHNRPPSRNGQAATSLPPALGRKINSTFNKRKRPSSALLGRFLV